MFIDITVRPTGEVQQRMGKLTLSEAVRAGLKLRGECKRAWQQDGRGCALVAACEATGLPYHRAHVSTQIFEHLQKLYPEAKDAIYHVPTLMDTEGYSREQVADWLEARGL